MSRIGKRQIKIPSGVNVTINPDNSIIVKGPKGSLKEIIHPNLKVSHDTQHMKVEIVKDNKGATAIQGTFNALITNMVKGVTEGFSKDLNLVGVGYRAALKGKELEIALGYSHLVKLHIPTGIEVKVPTVTEILISGIDKQQVGHFAALVRSKRPPEPYKGKGVLYKGEHIILKQGKTAKAGK